jgi:hypothetical protein
LNAMGKSPLIRLPKTVPSPRKPLPRWDPRRPVASARSALAPRRPFRRMSISAPWNAGQWERLLQTSDGILLPSKPRWPLSRCGPPARTRRPMGLSSREPQAKPVRSECGPPGAPDGGSTLQVFSSRSLQAQELPRSPYAVAGIPQRNGTQLALLVARPSSITALDPNGAGGAILLQTGRYSPYHVRS